MNVCAVLGRPVAHSLSPAIHNAMLDVHGEAGRYTAIEVEAADFVATVEELRGRGFRGVNITVPHKVAAAEMADQGSPDVEALGAANTLVFGDDISAHNTDVEGVAAALTDLGGVAGQRVLVLGAGGAGRAALLGARRAGAAELILANRTHATAVEVADLLGDVEVVAWEDRHRAVDGVINASSVGLEGAEVPVSAERLADAGCGLLLDLVYAADPTTLVAEARAAGMTADDGLGMLVHQAAAAYRLFWDRDADPAVMLGAARRTAGRD